MVVKNLKPVTELQTEESPLVKEKGSQTGFVVFKISKGAAALCI